MTPEYAEFKHIAGKVGVIKRLLLRILGDYMKAGYPEHYRQYEVELQGLLIKADLYDALSSAAPATLFDRAVENPRTVVTSALDFEVQFIEREILTLKCLPPNVQQELRANIVAPARSPGALEINIEKHRHVSCNVQHASALLFEALNRPLAQFNLIAVKDALERVIVARLQRRQLGGASDGGTEIDHVFDETSHADSVAAGSASMDQRSRDRLARPVCDVCNKQVDWSDGYVLSTSEVVTKDAYWEFVFAHQWSYMHTQDPDGASLVTLARNQGGQSTGWFLCTSCSALFVFDRDVAKQHAIRKSSQPPGSGPADFGQVAQAAAGVWKKLYGKWPSSIGSVSSESSAASPASPQAEQVKVAGRQASRPRVTDTVTCYLPQDFVADMTRRIPGIKRAFLKALERHLQAEYPEQLVAYRAVLQDLHRHAYMHDSGFESRRVSVGLDELSNTFKGEVDFVEKVILPLTCLPDEVRRLIADDILSPMQVPSACQFTVVSAAIFQGTEQHISNLQDALFGTLAGVFDWPLRGFSFAVVKDELEKLLIASSRSTECDEIAPTGRTTSPGVKPPEKGTQTATLLRAVQAEEAVVRAGEVLNRGIRRTPLDPSGVALSHDGGLGAAVRSVLETAVETQPNDPEYRYFVACAKILQGLGKDADDEIRRIASDSPAFVETALYVADPDKWYEPWVYPPWSPTAARLPESEFRIVRDTGRCYVVSVRDGMRRIVSFVTRWHLTVESAGKVPPLLALEPNLLGALPTTIRAKFMQTPYGALVGVYVLMDTHPAEPYTTETFLNVEAYHPDEGDLSQTGYWLIRLLAQQDYTYIVLADPSGRVLLNKKVEYDGDVRANLREVAERVRVLRPLPSTDMERLKKAQQYFVDHLSMDSIQFSSSAQTIAPRSSEAPASGLETMELRRQFARLLNMHEDRAELVIEQQIAALKRAHRGFTEKWYIEKLLDDWLRDRR